MKTFREMQLPESLHKALQAQKFETPTPIQAQAIPVVLDGRDLIGCAQTGTGKTAAFAVPLLAQLLEQKDKNALVLVPTRELASQVSDVLRRLSQFAPEIRGAMLIGGVPMFPQFKALERKPRVVIATPGRLVDHLKRRSLSLANTGILVLDEADRMLDMGFLPQLEEILPYLPKIRQTLLFSATVPPNILKLSNKFLQNPERVQVGETTQAAPKIEQQSREVRNDQKNGVVLDEVNGRTGTILIFAKTQSRTDRLAHYLEEYGVKVGRIHGGRTQGQRNKALLGFRNGSYRVLVATDIAARGLDIDHVAHVINYDLPQVPEDYIHRIGRTGRAGRSGEALSLISPDERYCWRAITRLTSGVWSEGPRPFQNKNRSSNEAKFGSRRDQKENRRGRSDETSFEERRRSDGRRNEKRPFQRGASKSQRHELKFQRPESKPQRTEPKPQRSTKPLARAQARSMERDIFGDLIQPKKPKASSVPHPAGNRKQRRARMQFENRHLERDGERPGRDSRFFGKKNGGFKSRQGQFAI